MCEFLPSTLKDSPAIWFLTSNPLSVASSPLISTLVPLDPSALNQSMIAFGPVMLAPVPVLLVNSVLSSWLFLPSRSIPLSAVQLFNFVPSIMLLSPLLWMVVPSPLLLTTSLICALFPSFLTIGPPVLLFAVMSVAVRLSPVELSIPPSWLVAFTLDTVLFEPLSSRLVPSPPMMFTSSILVLFPLTI